MRQKDSVNGSIRGRLPDGTANPIDLHVGAQLKKARLKRGLSQEKLAEEMGITFQQVQKYERGSNRIGASRLWDLAQVLQVPISYFYEGMAEDIMDKSPRKICTLSDNEEIFAQIGDLVLTAEDVLLIRDFKSIRNQALAQNIINLVHSLSAGEASGNITFPAETDDRDDTL